MKRVYPKNGFLLRRPEIVSAGRVFSGPGLGFYSNRKALAPVLCKVLVCGCFRQHEFIKHTTMSAVSLPVKNNVLVTKAIGYASSKAPLVCKDVEIPITPNTLVKPTELLVHVKAISLNPVDCVLKGLSSSWLGAKHKIVGGDFAGIVVKAGNQTNFKENDKIYGDVLSLVKRGSGSEYILFDISQRVICEKIPEGMSFEQAASLPIVSGTAHQCLSLHKDLKNANVLVLGAGTSVGNFTVQLAKHYYNAGKVVATCSSKSSDRVKDIGADLTIDYTKGDDYKVKQLIQFVKENGKFDIIVDTVRDEVIFDHFDQLLAPYTQGGLLSQVAGSYTIDYTDVRVSQLLPSWKKFSAVWKYKLGLSKYRVESILLEHNEGYGEIIEDLFKRGELKISFDSMYDAYTEAQKAYDRVASGKAKGKVVLKF